MIGTEATILLVTGIEKMFAGIDADVKLAVVGAARGRYVRIVADEPRPEASRGEVVHVDLVFVQVGIKERRAVRCHPASVRVEEGVFYRFPRRDGFELLAVREVDVLDVHRVGEGVVDEERVADEVHLVE